MSSTRTIECVEYIYIYIYIYVYNEQRRALRYLVYFNGISPVNIARVIAVRSAFFTDKLMAAVNTFTMRNHLH